MLDKLFNKLTGAKPEEEMLVAPLTGKMVKLEDVPDPVFAQRMMGDGLAITPSEGEVVSPVEGKIIQVFPTKHAIGIETKGGIEILIHIGLETVSMSGEGFEAFVKEGDKVKPGDLLIRFNLDLVKEKAKDIVTPVIITNGDQVESLHLINTEGTVKGETAVATVKNKG